MNLFLVSVIFILSIVAIRISNKYGISSLLLFFALGISFNFLGINFDNYILVENFSKLALLIIMFYGGFATNLKMARPVIKESIVMASLGVLFTSFFTGLFCHYILKMDFFEAMLLASVVGSTDFASVSSILKSKNLNLKYSTASLLELESGSNDPTAYTMTLVFISIITGAKVSIFKMVLLQVVFGIFIGYLVAKITEKIINKISFSEDGLFSIMISAVALLTFSVSEFLSGNGFLAVYILGIYLGNFEYSRKKEVVYFFDGFSRIMQISLFFILGLLSTPIMILKSFPIAILIMLFITFVARPLVTYSLLKPFSIKKEQFVVLSAAGLRGAAAIAFAIMVVNSPVNLKIDIFHIVFVICILSSLIQGSLLAPITKKVDMLDPCDTVLKTFNYYNAKSDLAFIETKLEKGNRLIGKKVAQLNIDLDVIVAKIIRDKKLVVPRGDTVIEEGDSLILAGKSYFDPEGVELTEIRIGDKHKWKDRYLKDIDMSRKELVVMMQTKEDEIVVPNGDSLLRSGDRLIILKTT